MGVARCIWTHPLLSLSPRPPPPFLKFTRMLGDVEELSAKYTALAKQYGCDPKKMASEEFCGLFFDFTLALEQVGAVRGTRMRVVLRRHSYCLQ